jgi:hypothetical protein
MSILAQALAPKRKHFTATDPLIPFATWRQNQQNVGLPMWQQQNIGAPITQASLWQAMLNGSSS